MKKTLARISASFQSTPAIFVPLCTAYCRAALPADERLRRGDLAANPYGKQINVYQEKTATSINAMTGEPFVGYATNPAGTWDLKDGTQKPMVRTLKVIQGIRPGVVAFPLGWGHWASGARDVVIDGVTIPGDPRRATGIHANAAMRVDPALKNVTLTDLAGGSAVFYDTRVKVERA